jgi:hypothetical protein
MKRLLPLMLAVWMTPLLTVCLGSDETDPPQDQQTPQRSERQTTRPARGDQNELEYLEQLRREMISKLDLDDEQLEAIRDIFKDRTAEVEAYYAEKRRSEAQDQQKMHELEMQIREARQAGDHETLRELMEEMRQLQGGDRELRRGRQEFHDALANELNEEQEREFRKIVQRLRRDQNPRRFRLRGIQDIRRATEDLGLSEEQNRAIRDYLVEAMRAVGETGNDEEKLAELQASLQQKIVDELTDEQAKQFLAKLEELRQQPETRFHGSGRPHPRNLQGPRDNADNAEDQPVDAGSNS